MCSIEGVVKAIIQLHTWNSRKFTNTCIQYNTYNITHTIHNPFLMILLFDDPGFCHLYIT